MIKKVTTKKIGKDFVLYHTERDEVHFANESAEIIYNLYKEGRSVQEIAQAIEKNFCLEGHENIMSDIKKCLEEMKSKGLVDEEKQ